MPSTYSTSNNNYVISIPNSQQDFLGLEQDLLPQTTVDEFEYYSPNRNIHTYSVMFHTGGASPSPTPTYSSLVDYALVDFSVVG